MPTPEQIRILIVIVPALFFILGLKRPIFAVAAYMIIVYCKTSAYYSFVAAIRGELLFAFLILFWLIVKNKSFFIKLSPNTDAINKYIFFLIICVMVSYVFAWDHQYSWDNAVYHLIKTLFLYIMIVGGVEDKTDLRIFAWSFVGMLAFLAYEPLYGYLFEVGGREHTYGTNYISELGILSGHVALANNMNQMIPIALYLLLGTKTPAGKIFGICALAMFVIALAGSGSRGGVVGLAVSACCITYYSKQKLKMAAILGIAVIIIGLSIGSSIVYTASRIDSTATEGRLIGLTHGIGMLTRGNILGVGPGCYLIARARYFGWRMESHNIYGQVMGDLGLPGMIVTFLLVREFFRGASFVSKRSRGPDEKEGFLSYLMIGIQVSLLVRLAISMASHGLYYFYWYVMAAMIVSSRHLVKKMD